MPTTNFEPGTIVTSTWLNEVDAATFSVKNMLVLGADPTGATNVSVIAQEALDTGKDVYFPGGTYLLTSPLELKTKNQRIFGDGPNSILLTTTDIKTIFSGATDIAGTVIENLQFKNTLNDASGGPTQFHVDLGTGGTVCTVRNCHFQTGLSGSTVRTTHHGGLRFQGANLNHSLDNTFQQCHILMESTDSTIRGGWIYAFASEYAIKITSQGEVVIDAVRGILGGPSKGCIWIPSASFMVKITGCYFGGSYTFMNTGNGVTAEQPQMLQIVDNTFHEVDGVGVLLNSPNSGNLIVGNTFWAGHAKQNDPTFATPGNPDIRITGTVFGANHTVITGNVFNRFLGPVEDGMPGVGKSLAVDIPAVAGTSNNIITANSVRGPDRYYFPAITSGNVNDIITNNSGTSNVRTWTPSDISGAGLTFSSVDCKYKRDSHSVTVWGSFTFPSTADAGGVTISGLPIAPIAGMEGGAGVLITNAPNVKKVKLVPGQVYFVLTNDTDAQVPNSDCSTRYFRFHATYMIA